MLTALTERPSHAHRVPPAPSGGRHDDLILGRYRLQARLAVGGSAEVWRAHDQQLDRPVAIKLLHEHLLRDRRARERLAEEAQAMGALSHRGIVRTYDLDLDGRRPALVLELIEGSSLAEHLADGPMDPRRVAALVAEVADALAHAHARGILHRDVKPGNVLLDRDGHAHLVDFGIARAVASSAAHLTQTGTVAGTLHYMAPEQLSDEPIGPAADLYALGVVMYEALAGRLPHPATAPLALARQKAGGRPPMPGTDPALAAIVRACLEPRPGRRPADAACLASALRGWLAGDRGVAPARAASRRRFVPAVALPRARPVYAALAASAAAGLVAVAIAIGSGGTPSPSLAAGDALERPAAGVVPGTPSGEALPIVVTSDQDPSLVEAPLAEPPRSAPAAVTVAEQGHPRAKGEPGKRGHDARADHTGGGNMAGAHRRGGHHAREETAERS